MTVILDFVFRLNTLEAIFPPKKEVGANATVVYADGKELLFFDASFVGEWFEE